MNPTANRKYISTRDYVYQTLRNDIISLALEPGKNVSEKEVAKKLDVSRTPVREAFLQLSQEELLDIYPQKGTFVSLIHLEHVEEGRFMREHLEKGVVALACDRLEKDDLDELQRILKMQELSASQQNHAALFELDEAFHAAIFKGCQKERIWSLIQMMNAHFNRIRLLRLSKTYDWDVILSHHLQIYNAIWEKDKVKAQQAITEHLRLVEFEREPLIHQYPSYFR